MAHQTQPPTTVLEPTTYAASHKQQTSNLKTTSTVPISKLSSKHKQYSRNVCMADIDPTTVECRNCNKQYFDKATGTCPNCQQKKTYGVCPGCCGTILLRNLSSHYCKVTLFPLSTPPPTNKLPENMTINYDEFEAELILTLTARQGEDQKYTEF